MEKESIPSLTVFVAGQRYAQVASYIHGDVLDLGCGYARVLRDPNAQIASYTGVDLARERIDWLKENYPGATFLYRDIDNEPLEIEQKFDCVLMVAIIEHLFNQKFVMENVAKVLKPGGIVVVTTPTPFGNDIVHRLGASFGLFSQEAADEHIVIYNRHRFEILANKIGFNLVHHHYFQ